MTHVPDSMEATLNSGSIHTERTNLACNSHDGLSDHSCALNL
jgi:hypothetical protein